MAQYKNSFIEPGFFKKLKAVIINGSEEFLLHAVGESHYQNNFNTICGPKTEEGEDRIVDVMIVSEDDNPYDRNAVALYVDYLKVGYLSRENVKDFRKKYLEKRKTYAICKGRIRGGWIGKRGEGSYGITLDVPLYE
jgi:hypothetical protein